MLIREYKPSDFKRICEIGKILDPAPPPLYFRAKLGDGKAWVVEVDGLVVGFLISTILYWKPRKTQLPYINSVAVDPAFQRLGIGHALLAHFEGYYKKFGLFGLYVRTDNLAAYNLYFKLGYRIVELLERFYGKDKDGYFMVKSVL